LAPLLTCKIRVVLQYGVEAFRTLAEFRAKAAGTTDELEESGGFISWSERSRLTIGESPWYSGFDAIAARSRRAIGVLETAPGRQVIVVCAPLRSIADSIVVSLPRLLSASGVAVRGWRVEQPSLDLASFLLNEMAEITPRLYLIHGRQVDKYDVTLRDEKEQPDLLPATQHLIRSRQLHPSSIGLIRGRYHWIINEDFSVEVGIDSPSVASVASELKEIYSMLRAYVRIDETQWDDDGDGDAVGHRHLAEAAAGFKHAAEDRQRMRA
jgi:hypothetical protein